MKILHRVLLLIIILIGQTMLMETMAQSRSMKDIQRRTRQKERLLEKDESKKVKAAKKKAEEQKKEQKNKEKELRAEEIKQHMDRQTPATRERMKETRKKSDEYRNRNREPFFKKIFKRKKKHYEG